MENKNISKENKVYEGVSRVPVMLLKAVGKFFVTIINVILTVGLICVIAGAVIGCAFLIYISNNVDMSVDDIVLITQDNELATKLYYYDSEGNLVENTDQDISSGTGSDWVEYEDVPTYLRDAFIAIEDKRFWDHNGVDWTATARATITFFIPIGSDRGGSTLTQQLIKNLTGDDDYSIQRKVQEIFRAINLEKELGDKRLIIEQYVNIVYFAQGAYGVQDAAQTYFSKDAKDLTLVECAALASIVQNPSMWDPLLYPENNRIRRQIVLQEMFSQGLITRAEYNEASSADLVIDTSYIAQSSGTTSWYTDAVIDEGIALLREKYSVSSNIAQRMFFSGGYQIITALDPEIQEIVEKYYEAEKSEYFKNSEVLNHEAAFIIMDPYNGQIKALAGGRGVKTASRILNRATSTTRSAGSTIKPLSAYALAVEEGLVHYGSAVEDTPLTSGYPLNFSRTYSGNVTLESALANSLNTIPVKLISTLGTGKVFNFLTQTLGLTTLVDNSRFSDKNLSALALGGMTYGVTLKQLTTAYTIFPSGGIYTESSTIIAILDHQGNVVVDNTPDQKVAISEETAQTMTKLMQCVISYGTGYSYTKQIQNLKLPTAAKSGTSSSNFDKWFVGFTPYYLAGSWIGYDQPQDLGSGQGQIRVWDAIMAEVHKLKVTSKGETFKSFEDNMLIKATYCKNSGKLVSDACLNDTRASRTATGYFTKDTLPTEECDIHVYTKICADCGRLANEYCPEASVQTKVFLNISRDGFSESKQQTFGDYRYLIPTKICECHTEPVIPETPVVPETPEIPETPETPNTPENSEE